jgi:hypothetical protein
MPVRSYPNRLVIGRDSATGFTRVGWFTEMLEDRFEQIEVLCETETSTPISHKSPYYDCYVEACERARQLNVPLLEHQYRTCLARGWYPVPLESDEAASLERQDEFGGQLSAATTAMSQLVHRDYTVWAVIAGGQITQVTARNPPKELSELEHQVWQADTLGRLSCIDGDVVEGELLATETGLWFRRTDETDK